MLQSICEFAFGEESEEFQKGFISPDKDHTLDELICLIYLIMFITLAIVSIIFLITDS